MDKIKPVYYTNSPFKRPINTICATIYNPNDYKFGLIVSTLSIAALRTLLVMAKHVQPNGKVNLHRTDVQRMIGREKKNVNLGISELVQYDLIARAKPRGYWLSPDVFQPVNLAV